MHILLFLLISVIGAFIGLLIAKQLGLIERRAYR